MPMAIYLSHRLVERQAECRDGRLPWLRRTPIAGHAPLRERQARIDRHRRALDPARPGIAHKQLEEAVIEHVVKPVLPKHMVKARSSTW